MDALTLFKADLGSFVRLYSFLSQIFDYGNTEIEKRFLFFKHIVRLLDFGRERDTVDLSQIVVTHHTLKNLGKRRFELGEGEAPKIAPVTEAGSGPQRPKRTSRRPTRILTR
jgi:type I restriction enzyme R subunit